MIFSTINDWSNKLIYIFNSVHHTFPDALITIASTETFINFSFPEANIFIEFSPQFFNIFKPFSFYNSFFFIPTPILSLVLVLAQENISYLYHKGVTFNGTDESFLLFLYYYTSDSFLVILSCQSFFFQNIHLYKKAHISLFFPVIFFSFSLTLNRIFCNLLSFDATFIFAPGADAICDIYPDCLCCSYLGLFPDDP